MRMGGRGAKARGSAGASLLLASLGVLDPGEYQSAAERYRRGGDAELGAALFATAPTELWLRTRA